VERRVIGADDGVGGNVDTNRGRAVSRLGQDIEEMLITWQRRRLVVMGGDRTYAKSMDEKWKDQETDAAKETMPGPDSGTSDSVGKDHKFKRDTASTRQSKTEKRHFPLRE